MDGGVAFGAGKAGQPFDPIGFLTRPQVILRFFCWLFSVIVFGCINNKGWHHGKCQYNGSANACRFGSILGIIGLLAAIVLLVLEGLFQNISSIKIRRRIVAIDLGFSGLWAILYFLCFASLGISWSRAPYPEFGYGINNLRTAIAFSFFSIFVWAGCAYFAWLRWKSGTDMSTFASAYPDDPNLAGGVAGGMPGGPGADYYAYASGTDVNEPAYQDQGMYSQQGVNNQYGGGGGNFQPPAY